MPVTVLVTGTDSEKLRCPSTLGSLSGTAGVAGGFDRRYESLGSPRFRGAIGPRRVSAPELEEGGAPAERWLRLATELQASLSLPDRKHPRVRGHCPMSRRGSSGL